jgi:hypothetical protein
MLQRTIKIFGIFFDPEKESDIFLLYVIRFSTDYMVLYPRRQFIVLSLLSTLLEG